MAGVQTKHSLGGLGNTLATIRRWLFPLNVRRRVVSDLNSPASNDILSFGGLEKLMNSINSNAAVNEDAWMCCREPCSSPLSSSALSAVCNMIDLGMCRLFYVPWLTAAFTARFVRLRVAIVCGFDVGSAILNDELLKCICCRLIQLSSVSHRFCAVKLRIQRLSISM